MNAPFTLIASLPLALLLAVGTAAGQAATEKIPPDKVIHPLLTGVSNPEIIPGTQKEPDYPAKWRKFHLGGRVILQGVVEKSGSVRDLTLLKTDLWVEPDCGGKSGDGEAKPAGGGETKDPAGVTGKDPGAPTVPLEARSDFEAAALKAVKKWEYRPGAMSGVPVDVYYTMIVKFTSCPKDPGKSAPRPH